MSERENAYTEKYDHYQLTGHWLVDFDPLAKLVIFLSIAAGSVAMRDWRYGAGVCVLYYIVAGICRRLKSFNKIFSKLLIVLGLVIVIIRLISVEGETVLVNVFGWEWTREALENGLTMASLVLSLSGAVIIFYEITPIRDLLYVLEQKGMSHVTSYIMLSSFQTIIDLKKTTQVILDSQKSRGVEVEGNVFVRGKALLPVLVPLLLGALSMAEERSIAMDARAFSVDAKHTFLRELRPMRTREKIITGIFVVYLLALIARRVYLMIG
jgi:energy-coupling factor transporter transmembrane protein EcfT